MKATIEKQRDPLAGQREAINRRESEHLIWPDNGQGCPVKVGEVFALRTCHIEITRTHRARKAAKLIWRAEFSRYYTDDRVWLLDRQGGYADTEAAAMREQDDPHASTIASLDPLDNPANLGGPLEHEAVAPYEIEELPMVIEAQKRFAAANRYHTEKRLDRSMASKLREVRIRARRHSVDVTDEMEMIEEATERARQKVRQAEVKAA